MRAQNEPPETAVRLVRGDAPGEATDVPGAYRVERVDEQALAEGRVWPQSRGSQLAGLAVGSQAGERTLDLCAAPGGKATMLAGEVVAVELHEARARELEENVRRLDAEGRVRVVVADGRALPAELTGFDRALVDAPCSGLGVLAARPDLRWRSEPLPELQLELLLAAAERVRPGGTVVYSVCTVNADESEAVVDASGPRDRPEPRRRVAGVPSRSSTRVPADAAAPPRHVGVLRRTAPGLGSRRGLGATGQGQSVVEPSLYAADFMRARRADRGIARSWAPASSTSTSATGTSSRR